MTWGFNKSFLACPVQALDEPICSSYTTFKYVAIVLLLWYTFNCQHPVDILALITMGMHLYFENQLF